MQIIWQSIFIFFIYNTYIRYYKYLKEPNVTSYIILFFNISETDFFFDKTFMGCNKNVLAGFTVIAFTIIWNYNL